MVTDLTQRAFCESCLTSRPLAEFRLRARNGTKRMRQCNRCHATAERDRIRQKRSELLGRQIDRFAREIYRAPNDERVAAICAQLVAAFGGIGPLVKEWHHHIQVTQAARRYKPFFDMIEAILRMARHAENAQKRFLERGSNEQLEERLQQKLMQFVADNPAFAAAALEIRGWRVKPPKVEDSVGEGGASGKMAPSHCRSYPLRSTASTNPPAT